MPKELPSPEMLRKLLRYDTDTGKLYWRKRMPDMFDGEGKDQSCHWWNSKYAGKEAFTANTNDGYKAGRIFDKFYRAHRVVWCLVHGEWAEAIDHINGDKSDNRIVNLRPASTVDNNKNLSLSVRNKSGAVGVSWNARCGKWRVQISDRRKRYHIGLFSNFEDAVSARKEAEIKYGYHENHGRETKC